MPNQNTFMSWISLESASIPRLIFCESFNLNLKHAESDWDPLSGISPDSLQQYIHVGFTLRLHRLKQPCSLDMVMIATPDPISPCKTPWSPDQEIEARVPEV